MFIMVLYVFFMLAAVGVAIAALWRVFEKAGQPGWAAVIPIYNAYVLTVEVCKKPILWFILTLVPLVGAVIMILLMIELAKAFGKSTAFAVGLILLSPVFLSILGFGDAQYEAPEGAPRRRREYDEEEEEEEEERRPARRRAAVEDEEEEEEEERPRRRTAKRRVEEEDEDEDEGRYEERKRPRR
jgi:hypothetical protein